MKKLILLSLFVLVQTVVKSQGLTLYNMDFVPQSMRSNPAQIQQSNFHLSLLPSVDLSYVNTGFTISDAFHGSGVKTQFTPGSLVGAIRDDNFISTKLNIDILSFGFKLKKHYFSFNVSDRIDFNFDYSKNFMTLLTEGNASPVFLGKTVTINGTGISLNHFREYAIGYAQQTNDNLSLGGRFKVLQGLSHFSNTVADITLSTDADAQSVTATSTLNVRMAGLAFLTDSLVDLDPAAYASNFSNIGFAVDLGGKYKINERLSATLNVNNLGFISWKSEARRYFNNQSNFEFTGVSDDQLQEDDFAENLGDSISDVFGLDRQDVNFSTPLTADIFIGGEYQLNNDFIAGALVNAKVFKGSIYPSLTLSGQTNLGKWMQLIASYSILNNSYTNVGLGAAVNAGPIQLYAVSDNVLGFTAIDYANNVNVQFGLNLLLGYKPKVTKQDREASKRKKNLSKLDTDGDGTNDYEDKCPEVEGYLNGCPDKDNDGVGDHADVCPDVMGDPALFGCPDSDGDNIADKDDKCPNEYGTLNGCLDTDGDSIPDYEDACPNDAGEGNGCPDADGDGVSDEKDICPEKPGKPENGGCPDTDGDGIYDNDDRCPETKGSAEYLGCTAKDSDKDTTPDVFDECPFRSGSAENNGCPE